MGMDVSPRWEGFLMLHALPRALLVFEGIYRKRWGEKLVKPVNMAKPLQVDLKYGL